LLHDAGRTAAPAAAPKEAASNPMAGEGSLTNGDIEFLLNQAEQALESINAASAGELPQGVLSYRLQEFSGTTASSENATLDLIRDVELDLKIELGRTNMYLEDVLKLRKGSVVPLDKLAGDPVDIYVNGRLIARGEVLVLNDNFCVRVAELIAGANVFG
jgi:flagellar motor switch protein FliN/FliY